MPVTYSDLCQYDRLADAYLAVCNEVPLDLEERATNILNHLVWESYHPGDDRINDQIVEAALGRLLRYGELSQDRKLLRLVQRKEG